MQLRGVTLCNLLEEAFRFYNFHNERILKNNWNYISPNDLTKELGNLRYCYNVSLLKMIHSLYSKQPNQFQYFYDEKKEHALKPNLKKLSFADAEFQMRRHAYIFKKYKNLYSLKKNIFNANADPNHYMDVFPKVDFDKLFGVKH